MWVKKWLKKIVSMEQDRVNLRSMPSFWENNGFVCVEVLRPSQPNGVMSSPVSLPNHTFTGQA